jgi:hypothetical protein
VFSLGVRKPIISEQTFLDSLDRIEEDLGKQTPPVPCIQMKPSIKYRLIGSGSVQRFNNHSFSGLRPFFHDRNVWSNGRWRLVLSLLAQNE